jgi:hypothetical protein
VRQSERINKANPQPSFAADVTKRGSESDLAEGLVINGEILRKVPQRQISTAVVSRDQSESSEWRSEAQDIQQPHNHYDNDDGIQNRLIRSDHGFIPFWGTQVLCSCY